MTVSQNPTCANTVSRACHLLLPVTYRFRWLHYAVRLKGRAEDAALGCMQKHLEKSNNRGKFFICIYRTLLTMARRSNNVKGSRAPRRGGRQQAAGSGMSNPPPFRPTISCSHRFRFENSTRGGSSTVTRGDILSMVVVAMSSTATVRILESVRLRSVEMWANPQSFGAGPPSMQIEWKGENAPSTVISDTSMGVRPAHIRSRPPARSSAQWWSMSGSQESDELFSLVLPNYCIVDVVVDMRFVDTENPSSGPSSTGLILGKLYAGYLDGNAYLHPVGMVPLA